MKNRFITVSDRHNFNQDVAQKLFSGLKLRFSALSRIETIVCWLIILTPLWWLWGWSYLFIVLTLATFAYEIKQSGSLSLDTPSWVVVWALCFGCYSIIAGYAYLKSNNIIFSPRQMLGVVDSWLTFALLTWYIQSKKLKIRLQVVAWSFSVLVILMLGVFLVSLVVFKQADYLPLRSLFGLLTDKGTVFEHGLGNSNYLIPYFATDESFIPGLVRYVFFFHGPESLALVAGFIALLALDLKNRPWSLTLFAGAYFISLLSGTRSVLVSLVLVVVFRYVITAGKTFGVALILTVMATVSFATFSFPPTSNLLFDSIEQTAQEVNDTRADSSQGRGEIYVQTWEKIVNAPDLELLFGHVVPGESVTPNYEPAKIGTHSFYLSTLLYRSGIIGTIIFLVFWVTLFWWFYSTQTTRPLCCLLVFILFTLTFTVMELEGSVMPIILICSMLEKSPQKARSFHQNYE